MCFVKGESNGRASSVLSCFIAACCSPSVRTVRTRSTATLRSWTSWSVSGVFPRVSRETKQPLILYFKTNIQTSLFNSSPNIYIPSLLPRFLQTWHPLMCRDWAQFRIYRWRLWDHLPECKTRPWPVDGPPSGYLIQSRSPLWQRVWKQNVPGARDWQWNGWSDWGLRPWRQYRSCPIHGFLGSWCVHLQYGAHGINIRLGEFVNANASLYTVFQFVHFLQCFYGRSPPSSGEYPNKEDSFWISFLSPC